METKSLEDVIKRLEENDLIDSNLVRDAKKELEVIKLGGGETKTVFVQNKPLTRVGPPKQEGVGSIE